MQKLFFNYRPLSTDKLSVISLALRVLIGGAMLSHGIPKLRAFFVIYSANPFSVKELAMVCFMIYVAIFSLGSGSYSADRLIGNYFAGHTGGGRV
ncbi:MAG: hypothetical protein RR555_07995 [Bacteroidales bacterium]